MLKEIMERSMNHSMDSAVWPANSSHYVRPLVTMGYLVTACTLATFLAKRITTISALRSMSVARALVLAVLLDSFLFVFTSAILVIGIGTSLNEIACAVGIWWCIMLYATSKVFIYLFLMERVHLVFCHTSGGRVPRHKSPWYRVSCLFFAAWIVVAILMIVDAAVNLFLTSAFVIPIYRKRFGKAQTLARNSVVAALMALATSFANIVILAIQDGKQLSWVCLGACGLDVFFNACIIFYITSAPDRRESAAEPSGTMSSMQGGGGSRRASGYPATTYFPGNNAMAFPSKAASAFPNLNRNDAATPAVPTAEPLGSSTHALPMSLPMSITQTVTVSNELEHGMDMITPSSTSSDEEYYLGKAPNFHAV